MGSLELSEFSLALHLNNSVRNLTPYMMKAMMTDHMMKTILNNNFTIPYSCKDGGYSEMGRFEILKSFRRRYTQC